MLYRSPFRSLFQVCVFALSHQDVLNNLGSSELDEDDLMLDLDLSDDQRHRHGNVFSAVSAIINIWARLDPL